MKRATGKNTVGMCSYRDKQILLAEPYVRANDFDEVLDTIKHEIAHALAWLENKEHGHGWYWRQWCIRIGCPPEACYKQGSIRVAEEGHVLRCWFCDYEYWGYARKPRGIKICPDCGEKLESHYE